MDTTSLPPDDRPPVTGPRRANRGLLWASALAVVVLAIATIVAFTAGDGSDDTERLDKDATQPVDGDLTGTDVTGRALPEVAYETFDGAEVALATGGKPLLVNFWASTCIPCVTEMPDLEAAYQAHGDDVGFLGLQVAEKADDGLDMIATTGITYPVGRDPRGDVIQALGGRALPRTVLVRADGTIAYAHTGILDADEIQALFDEKLG
jgi:thiol-disulfide isomerase/thioredoxin